MKNSIITFAMLLSLTFILSVASAHSYHGPRALLVENITGTYDTTGLDGASSGTSETFTSTGYIKVFVPNTDDILQYVRINFTNAIARTNIENWNGTETAYADYAQSYPQLTYGTNMYLNLTTGNKEEYYTPDFDYAPSLNISMSLTNTRAGDDLHSEKDILAPINILNFNFTIINPASTKNIVGTNITYNITFNTTGSNASVCIISSTVEETAGTAWARLRGTGCDYDAIEWQGTLDAGTQVDITFNATSLGGNNYLGTSNNLNDGLYGANALYMNSSHVISEITFAGRFARGPIREGIDLMKGTPWRVKSYINNIANSSVAPDEHSLTYFIDSWRVYNVTAATGQIDTLLDSNNDLNSDLAANVQFKIPSWIDTTSAKPYIAAYFNWSVYWNATNYYTYSGKINFSMKLPTLYEIDTLATKETSDTFAPEIYGSKLLTYNATAYHLGNSDDQIKVGKLQIYSVTPNSDVGAGNYANLTVINPHVYYANSTSIYELAISGSVGVTMVNTTQTRNSTIVLDITDLSIATLSVGGGTVGRNLTNGDYICLVYDIYTHENSSGSLTSGIDNDEWFHFYGNQTLWTQSGTYIVYNSSDLQQASMNSLSAYKQLLSTDPSEPEIVNVTLRLDVTGTINNIKFIDYIPTGMSNTSVVTMTSDLVSSEYNRTNLGTILTTDGLNMTAWEITNLTANDGWDLTDGYIEFSYNLNLTTAGLYVLPVQIAAFDPGVDNSISLTRYGIIKYVVPEKTRSLVIDEDDTLQLFKTVIVGKPGVWRKSFSVYNPNSKPVKSQFRTEVFKDTVESYANYYDSYGKNIEESIDTDVTDNKKYIFWESTLKPYESRTYELRVLTPPAVEVDRDVEVLEKLENKHVKLKADIVIKNFAEEPYTNLKLNLNIPSDNIFELTDAFGREIPRTGDTSSTTVTIPRLDANTVMSLSIIYKQSYPTVIITPDRTRYDSGEIANLEILIINGGEKIENPSIETEIFTEDMDLVYADIIRLESSLKPLEKTELSTKFLLPMNAPTGKYLANIRFSEDMTIITENTIDFYVLGIKSESSSSAKVLIIVLIGAVLIYFAYKRLVRVTKK